MAEFNSAENLNMNLADLRITVTAAHCEEQLRQAAQIITALWQELKHGEKKEG